MKKETVIAIILGITLGAIIALILIFGAHSKGNGSKKVVNTKETPTVVNLNTSLKQFEITDPKNNSATSKDTIAIKGISEKNSLIVVQSKNTEKVISTDVGSFSVDFPVSLGENVIRITEYNGTSISDKLLTIYRIQE